MALRAAKGAMPADQFTAAQEAIGDWIVGTLAPSFYRIAIDKGTIKRCRLKEALAVGDRVVTRVSALPKDRSLAAEKIVAACMPQFTTVHPTGNSHGNDETADGVDYPADETMPLKHPRPGVLEVTTATDAVWLLSTGLEEYTDSDDHVSLMHVCVDAVDATSSLVNVEAVSQVTLLVYGCVRRTGIPPKVFEQVQPPPDAAILYVPEDAPMVHVAVSGGTFTPLALWCGTSAMPELLRSYIEDHVVPRVLRVFSLPDTDPVHTVADSLLWNECVCWPAAASHGTRFYPRCSFHTLAIERPDWSPVATDRANVACEVLGVPADAEGPWLPLYNGFIACCCLLLAPEFPVVWTKLVAR